MATWIRKPNFGLYTWSVGCKNIIPAEDENDGDESSRESSRDSNPFSAAGKWASGMGIVHCSEAAPILVWYIPET